MSDASPEAARDSGLAAFGPEDYAAATGAGAGEMDDLKAFRALLEDWSGRMNLVGPSALAEFWRRHAFDSAQLLDLARPEERVWADIGAGAGFPGIVLAVRLKHQGHAESRAAGPAKVHLIESLAKRCRFLSEAVSTLDLPAEVHNARAEDLRLTGIDIVTARACAPLPKLLGYAAPLLKKRGARGLFPKGREAEAELAEARKTWTFEASMTESRSDPSGRILSIERLARVR
jgi:16S rRNA (guanine527-N7)-methyltransferase